MNILYCLRRAKQFHGETIASFREEGETTQPITWNEFYDRVHRVAAFFRDLEIQKGDRVAIWMLNSHKYLELYYATAGIVVVPVNTRKNERIQTQPL
jgi:acyl-CoA synthetase (AMP-forming)/AMP-acid ligase II